MYCWPQSKEATTEFRTGRMVDWKNTYALKSLTFSVKTDRHIDKYRQAIKTPLVVQQEISGQEGKGDIREQNVTGLSTVNVIFCNRLKRLLHTYTEVLI